MKLDPQLYYTTHQCEVYMDQRLTCRTQYQRRPDEYMWKKFLDIGIGNDFWGMIPKTQTTSQKSTGRTISNLKLLHSRINRQDHIFIPQNSQQCWALASFDLSPSLEAAFHWKEVPWVCPHSPTPAKMPAPNDWSHSCVQVDGEGVM